MSTDLCSLAHNDVDLALTHEGFELHQITVERSCKEQVFYGIGDDDPLLRRHVATEGRDQLLLFLRERLICGCSLVEISAGEPRFQRVISVRHAVRVARWRTGSAALSCHYSIPRRWTELGHIDEKPFLVCIFKFSYTISNRAFLRK
jgi:hypothetical protein